MRVRHGNASQSHPRRDRTSLAKVENDLTNIAAGPAGNNIAVQFIGGGAVSAQLRDRAERAASVRGFISATIWSAADFEEQLRLHSPELLRRFVGGELFPELPDEITAISVTEAQRTDSEIVTALARAFDRPAFKTHFYQESSLPRA